MAQAFDLQRQAGRACSRWGAKTLPDGIKGLQPLEEATVESPGTCQWLAEAVMGIGESRQASKTWSPAPCEAFDDLVVLDDDIAGAVVGKNGQGGLVHVLMGTPVSLSTYSSRPKPDPCSHGHDPVVRQEGCRH